MTGWERPNELVGERPWHLGMAAAAGGLALTGAGAPVGISLVLAGALAALLTAGVGERAGAVVALGAVAGLTLGMWRLAAVDAAASRASAGDRVEARGHLLSPPRRGRFGWTAEVRVASGPAAGALLLARAPPGLRAPHGATPGWELALSGVVREPEARPGQRFDFAAYLRRRGFAGELALERARATGRRRDGLAGVVDVLRDRAQRGVERGLTPARAALAKGMVLGQDESIDRPLRDDFRASGLGHLLAVSGQNVMLLGALALPLLAAAGLSPSARAAATLGLVAVYVPLAGAGPSLQRAGVMGAASLTALIASRPASRWYALLLAAAATLALDPRACRDPGWQLSFAAVAGILTLAPGLRRPLGGLPRPLAEGAAITVAATLATAPLVAHHFGSVPLAGLPANLLALPAVAPIMWIGMLQAALGQLAPTPLAPVAEAAASLLGSGAGPILGYLGWLAGRFADLPGAGLSLSLPSPLLVAAAYGALAGAAALAGSAAARVEPAAAQLAARWRRLPRLRRGALALLAAAACALVLLRAGAPPPPPRELTVSFLDVGQGDATLIQDPGGAAVLFDGGPPEARVARLLRRAGVSRLALVVATHASRDHHGGLREVIERFPVDVLLDGGDGTRDHDFRALLGAAADRGVRVQRATAPLELGVGALRIQILSPPPRPRGPAPQDPNRRAVVAVVSAGRFDLMLSADAESEGLAPLRLPDVDAMKVPHHGSSDPGLPDLLERLRPELAAIEVGEGNGYGHPHPGTIAALRDAGVPTYRTDRDGTVRLTVASRGMRVATTD